MPTDHPDPPTPPADRQPRDPSPRHGPIREALLGRFSDPEDAASLRRVGTILEELLDSSEQCGPETHENQIRPAVLAVVRDLLADVANLAAIAEQRAWDGDLSSEETSSRTVPTPGPSRCSSWPGPSTDPGQALCLPALGVITVPGGS